MKQEAEIAVGLKAKCRQPRFQLLCNIFLCFTTNYAKRVADHFDKRQERQQFPDKTKARSLSMR